MKRLGWLAVIVCAACGSKSTGDAGATSDAGEDVAVQDAVDDAWQPTTTVADVATDSGADTAAADVPAKPSPAAQQCADIASAICAAAKTCCTTAGISSDCLAFETERCMKSGFAGIDDASAAGIVKQDPKRAGVCTQALADAAKACDYAGLQAARRLCLLSWYDPASKGDQCTATAPIACDSFSGRCDPVTVDSYACRKAGGDGDSCKLGSPCGIELECLNGTLTRDMKCGTPGSTCNLSDTCPQGKKCNAGVCEAWADGGKEGAACKADTDCAIGWKCDTATSKCTGSLCGL